MPRYLISFDDGSMDHISEQDLPAVSEASHAVVREIKQAGAWIFGGGVMRQQASIVATDGSVADGPVPETKAVVGGFSIIEVSSAPKQTGQAKTLELPAITMATAIVSTRVTPRRVDGPFIAAPLSCGGTMSRRRPGRTTPRTTQWPQPEW